PRQPLLTFVIQSIEHRNRHSARSAAGVAASSRSPAARRPGRAGDGGFVLAGVVVRGCPVRRCGSVL
ncbi:hypothetical protein, partial [Streptomyces sp. NPDC001494]